MLGARETVASPPSFIFQPGPQSKSTQRQKTAALGCFYDSGSLGVTYFEEFFDIRQAIAREKEIKGWLRSRKIQLIESTNPGWKDLSLEWLPDK
jgi:predicted GIY-YIG superfamily endonuclease